MEQLFHLFWAKARDSFKNQLQERYLFNNSFNRTYLRMQECDYTKELAEDLDKLIQIQKPKIDYWRPYLYQAINFHLGKAYILNTHNDIELEKIITLLDEAIRTDYDYLNGKDYK